MNYQLINHNLHLPPRLQQRRVLAIKAGLHDLHGAVLARLALDDVRAAALARDASNLCGTTLSRNCRGPVDGVAVACQRVDAIFPKLKFRKRKKRTPSQHEVPVPDAASFGRRVLHAAREVVHA